MRKLVSASMWLMVLLSILNPGMVLAQTPIETKTPEQKQLKKITVTKDGAIKDEDGKNLDRRLFIFTSTDPEGKNKLRAGRARYRPETMYIDESHITKNGLDDKSSADYKKLREYIKAERKVAKTLVRKADTATKRKNGKRSAIKPITTAQTVNRNLTITKSQIEEITKSVTAAVTAENEKQMTEQKAAFQKFASEQKDAASSTVSPAPWPNWVIIGPWIISLLSLLLLLWLVFMKKSEVDTSMSPISSIEFTQYPPRVVEMAGKEHALFKTKVVDESEQIPKPSGPPEPPKQESGSNPAAGKDDDGAFTNVSPRQNKKSGGAIKKSISPSA